MNNMILRPVIFNVITIVALLITLSQVLSYFSEPSGPLLVEVGEESGLVDETLLATVRQSVETRAQLSNVMVVVIIVSILSNIIANYLGRQRQRANQARIEALEAQLREK